MPDFDPTEFISLAEELLSNLPGASVDRSGPDQAKVRTAIGSHTTLLSLWPVKNSQN